jgi:ribosomal protein S18 acetylase RimI-like enzyme
VALIRRAEARDRELIAEMLVAAADWRPGTQPRSVADMLTDPALAHYARDWPQDGDLGFVAEDESGVGVGAAWWRFFPSADPGYGFVDEAVPEVAIGVAPGSRGRGIGRALLDQLVAAARSDGLAGLSLSVETDNFAVRLYEQVGFERRGTSGDSLTMLLPLAE